jgi:pimeloyl-ACP methyl ester carboxylesterase
MTALSPFEWLTLGDGHRLRIRRASRPGAPALLLTNAWPQTIRCWDRQWGDLAAQYDLTAVDLPGFGISPGDDAVMRPSTQAEVVGTVIDTLGLDHPTWIAPDVGVPIAISLAARRPGLLSGLVLFDGPSEFPPAISWEGRLLVRSRIARRIVGWLGIPFTLETIRRGYRLGRRPSRTAVVEYLRAFGRPSRFSRTLRFVGSYPEELPLVEAARARVEIPALVTWGERDVFVFPSNGPRLVDALPNATFRPLVGAGHYSHEDAGDEFLAVFEAWMATRTERLEQQP